MKKSEFYKAVSAYLKGTANSWQQFIVEDYYDSFRYCNDVLDVCSSEQLQQIRHKMYAEINKSIAVTSK